MKPISALLTTSRGRGVLLVLMTALGLASCFRGLDPSKVPCTKSDQCPDKYTCSVPANATQGHCVLGSADGGLSDQRLISGGDGPAGSAGKDGNGGSTGPIDAKTGTGGSTGGSVGGGAVSNAGDGVDAPVGGANGGAMGGTSVDDSTATGGALTGGSTGDSTTATGGTVAGGAVSGGAVSGGTTTTSTPVTGGTTSTSSSTPPAPKGTSCTDNKQCASTYCVDGVCCDGKCDGNCESCSKDGTCGFSQTPRKACGGTGKCVGECKSPNRATCTFPDDLTVCTAQSCTAGVRQNTARCDGKGACKVPDPATTDCVGGQCKSDGTDCATCTDETVSTTCAGGKCVPTVNNCQKTVTCPACSGTGVTCGGGGTPGVCGCTSESKATTCGTATCGDKVDNCGKTVSCGTCPGGHPCISGSCCTPDCTGKCGGADDGCGGTCTGTGGCTNGQVCKNGACCSPNCTGKCNGGLDPVCGSACAGTSGCTNGQVCTNGSCCSPNCSGKCNGGLDSVCSSACAGTSGCSPGQVCTTNLSCCTPDCTGKCGGSNGCGGTCPNTCTLPETCGGGGTTNVCGCSDANACTNHCGTLTNACNRQVTCPGCNGGAQCVSNTCQCPYTEAGCGPSCLPCGTGMSCSASSHTCVCPQKSSGNLVTNPGFDSGLSGWDNLSGSTTISWDSASDANTCSASGSARVVAELTQCIPVSGVSTFYMGFSYRQTSGSAAICTLWFSGDTTCGGRLGDPRRDLLMVIGQVSPTGGTAYLSNSGSITYSGTDPLAAVYLRCFSQDVNANVWIDKVYVRTTSGGF